MLRRLTSRFLDTNKKELNRLEKIVIQINDFEPEMKKLADAKFKSKTKEFKKRIQDGETLESILPEAFALVREATWRSLGMRHFDVQIMAAIALFEGNVAEQKTGEGKTLSAVPALYLRALTGKGVHLVTVNDYLARRDAGWNAPVFDMLGLSVGVIIQNQSSFVYDPIYKDDSHGDDRLAHLKPVDRKQAYEADITYGTNNEFGFDYLRDNMVSRPEQKSQRGHYFAIVDEVDSVLIDEARTPLIISQPDTEPTQKYHQFAKMVKSLKENDHFTIDEKVKSASLTEKGIEKVEQLMGINNLYEKDFEAIHHIENALRAKSLYIKDREYVVKDGEVVIVDENTGRLMIGRRWSDGLHQAVEAKEEVVVQQESKTLATISFQNYFRMYEVLAGMTGTAETEAEEFKKIYQLDVVVIPTNKPNNRDDKGDVVYKTLKAKYDAIIKDIDERRLKGQPILVGTTSIEKNELISTLLKKHRIPHNILNAKNHEREALIIADAGKPGAVTVATNMAGRGVDIVLGGSQPELPPGEDREKHKKSNIFKKWEEQHQKVIKSGGLHVIGTERHESRRIDNQLRGRSGRQGDPGSTRFFLSLQDDLMRIFGGDQVKGIMDRFNLPEDQPIENKLVTRVIQQAQVKVEGHNFDIRKSVVEYDDVANQQREVIYKLRDKVLVSKDLKDEILDKLDNQVEILVAESIDPVKNKLNPEKAMINFMEIVPFDEKSRDKIKDDLKGKTQTDATKHLKNILNKLYESREKQIGDDTARQIDKFAYLGAIDHHWIDHIDRIDGLRQSMGLRAYAQKDPIVEFKNEAFNLFEGLIDRIDRELGRRIFRIQAVRRTTPEIDVTQARTNVDTSDQTGLAGGADMAVAAGQPAFQTTGSRQQAVVNKNNNKDPDVKKQKLGRNDPCWCGSGKKWKKCHYPQTG